MSVASSIFFSFLFSFDCQASVIEKVIGLFYSKCGMISSLAWLAASTRNEGETRGNQRESEGIRGS